VEVAAKLLGVILSGAASSADLGSSSKYSSETLEDRSGEREHGMRPGRWRTMTVYNAARE